MTATITPRTPVTAAVLDALRTAWPPRSGDVQRVGDNEAPDDLHAPYAILYAVDGGEWRPQVDGTYDGVFVYQVSTFGERRDQAVALSDLLVAAVYALRDSAFDDLRISLVEPDVSPLAPAKDGRLWLVPDRLRIQVVPDG